MKELLVLFLDNLCIIGVGMAIFICAFLSNMSFSVYRNISILHEGWSWEKFWKGITKAIAFLVGLTLLCLSVTAIPFFAERIGWVIPKEYAQAFSDLAIIGVILTVSASYALKAFGAFKEILNYEEPAAYDPEPTSNNYE